MVGLLFFWRGGGGESMVRILLEVGGPFKSHAVDASEIRPAAVDIENLTLLLGFCISQLVQGFLPSTVWKRSCGSSTEKKSERTGRNGSSWKLPLQDTPPGQKVLLVPASTQLPTVTLSLTRSLSVQGDWCFFNTFFLVLGTWYLLLLISKSFRMYMGVSLNGGTPKTPQNDHFLKEKPWLLGTTILGKPHIILNFWTPVFSWKSWSQDPTPPIFLEDLDPVAPVLDPKAGPIDQRILGCFLSTRKESNSTYKYNIYNIYIYIIYVYMYSWINQRNVARKETFESSIYMIICVYTPTYIHTHTHIVWSSLFQQPWLNLRRWAPQTQAESRSESVTSNTCQMAEEIEMSFDCAASSWCKSAKYHLVSHFSSDSLCKVVCIVSFWQTWKNPWVPAKVSECSDRLFCDKSHGS